MEQSQLFNMPIQAVYTRTLTWRRWGARPTGQIGSTAYTALVGEDRGGGTVILPGPASSSSAPQDFHSFFGIARFQHALPGRSFASLLVTDREIQGGGYNRVLGPDFQWTPGVQDQVLGQFLYSSTENPNRPDLSREFTGNTLSSHAAYAGWNHSSLHWNWSLTYKDIGDGFRADDGFVPQVGIREGLGNLSYVFYPTGFFTRVIPLAAADYVADTSGEPVTKVIAPGINVQGKANLQAEIDFNVLDRQRAGPNLLRNEHVHFFFRIQPPGPVGNITLEGHEGRA